MTTPSDTPRTDSQSSFDEFDVESCDASFARKLESELSAANNQIGLLIAGSKQQERQIEFLQETIHRLVEAGDKLVDPAWGNTGWKSSVLNELIDAWTKAKEGM